MLTESLFGLVGEAGDLVGMEEDAGGFKDEI